MKDALCFERTFVRELHEVVPVFFGRGELFDFFARGVEDVQHYLFAVEEELAAFDHGFAGELAAVVAADVFEFGLDFFVGFGEDFVFAFREEAGFFVVCFFVDSIGCVFCRAEGFVGEEAQLFFVSYRH